MQPRQLFPACDQPAEARALQFFRTRVARSLSGPYDSYFWSGLILQVSNSEPIVRHAVIAISSLYEDFSCKGKEVSRLSTNPFALSHYSNAVRKLRDVRYEPLVLLACLLFVCIEIIQDNREQAIIHCQHGLAILQSIQTTAVWARDYLAPIFHRLSPLPIFYARFTGPDRNPLTHIPKNVSSLSDANYIVENIIARMLQLTCNGTEYLYGCLRNPSVRPAPSAAYQELKGTIEQFVPALVRFGKQLHKQDCSEETRTWYTCCELRAEFCRVLITAAQSPDETTYDQFIGKFRYMVGLSRSLSWEMEKRIESHQGPEFRFEIGYLMMVHIIVMKCRDLVTRLEALELVKTHGATRENFWESDTMYQLGRRIIEVEHGVILNEKDMPIGWVAWTNLPPEENRVRDFYFNKDLIIQAEVDGLAVMGKPIGFIMRNGQGNAYLQHEFIWLDPVSLI